MAFKCRTLKVKLGFLCNTCQDWWKQLGQSIWLFAMFSSKMKMSETWQMSKQRNACCIHWRGKQSRKQFRIFHPIANTSCVAVDSDRLKCSAVTLVESVLAFRMLAVILWLQDTMKMELPRYPETSWTTRLTSQHRISEEASLHQYLCENLKSHIPCGCH
jgi:hypothetical protein